MKIATHEVGFEALDSLQNVDALLLFVGTDERPLRSLAGLADWRMVGGLSRVLKERFFEGELDDWLLVPSSGRFPFIRIFVLGVGSMEAVGAERLAHVLKSSAERLKKAGMHSVALEIPGGPTLDDESRVLAFRRHFVPVFGGTHVAVLGPKPLQKLVNNAAREFSEDVLHSQTS